MKFRDTLKDLALNIIIPFAIYTIAKKYFSASELVALSFSSLYPIFDTLVEFYQDRTLNVISGTVLLGTITGIIGVLLGGNPKLLLIRESFFTGFLGIICFVSLPTKKPFIFYFAREYIAGKDSEKRRKFSEVLKNRQILDLFRFLTFIWGIAYVGEFILRIIIVYSFPVPVVLIISPIIFTIVTVVAIIWTSWYSKRRREQIRGSV